MAEQAVCFYTGRFGHPFFQEQLRSAPVGYPYRTAADGSAAVSNAPRRITLQGSRMRWMRGGLERVAIRGLASSGHVRRRAFKPPPGCSLIHSAQQLLRGPDLPYVVDFECIEVFCLYQRAALKRPWARRRLLDAMSDERCRFLLPW